VGNRATESDRKARLLDEQWPRLWLLIPDISKILAGIAGLHTMEGIERSETIANLLSQLELFHAEFNEFAQSAEVKELLQEAVTAPSVVSHHSSCCPRLPFTPYYLQYPPAVHLRIVIFCLRIFMHTIFYPILRSEVPSNRSSDEENAGHSSLELCRTYAGIEDLFWDDKDSLLPCFSTLVTAGLYCPANLRKWLWYKLAHLETLSPYAFEPLKKRYSILWGISNLTTDGFGVWKSDPPEQGIGVVSADDIDVVSQMAGLNLNELEDR
jgi:hypothetical protein